MDMSLPKNGQLAVAGYVVTDKFRFWIRDGTDGAGEIVYKL